MTSLLCLALLRQALVPSPELAAKLEELDTRRPAFETRRAQAKVVRVSAFVGYGLTLASAAWAIAGLVVEGQRRGADPLAGVPAAPVVPPLVLGLAAVGFLVIGAVLHVNAWSMDTETANRESDLEAEERHWRAKLSPPDVPE